MKGGRRDRKMGEGVRGGKNVHPIPVISNLKGLAIKPICDIAVYLSIMGGTYIIMNVNNDEESK